MTIFTLAKCIMHAYDLPCSCLEKRLLRIQGQCQFFNHSSYLIIPCVRKNIKKFLKYDKV